MYYMVKNDYLVIYTCILNTYNSKNDIKLAEKNCKMSSSLVKRRQGLEI